MTEKLIMNVRVPVFSFAIEGNLLSYGTDGTVVELDQAIVKLKEVLERLVKLAEAEKTIELVADEIEKTRRRVNALEHVLIPQQAEIIRMISSKLEELERGNITRLMRIKQLSRQVLKLLDASACVQALIGECGCARAGELQSVVHQRCNGRSSLPCIGNVLDQSLAYPEQDPGFAMRIGGAQDASSGSVGGAGGCRRTAFARTCGLGAPFVPTARVRELADRRTGVRRSGSCTLRIEPSAD